MGCFKKICLYFFIGFWYLCKFDILIQNLIRVMVDEEIDI